MKSVDKNICITANQSHSGYRM